MENNIQNKSFLEIPLTPCSNIHLFKQLHLFISQNNLPIDITLRPTSISRPKSIQTGGGEAPFIYQHEYTPYTLFSNFMDRIFLQKKQDNIQDTENKKVLDSMFSKDKTKKQILQSLETISDQKKKEDAIKEEAKKQESKKEEEKTQPKEEPKTEKPKIIIKPIEETNKLYMHIQTNHPNPIEAIKGTKLYYLYQRQQENLCAHLV